MIAGVVVSLTGMKVLGSIMILVGAVANLLLILNRNRRAEIVKVAEANGSYAASVIGCCT